MRNDRFLEAKIALVTGAGRGIGRAIALALSAAGARVVLASRTGSELAAVGRAIRDRGGESLPVPCDITVEEQVMGLYDAIDAEMGPLDILVNNAGVGIFAPLTETSLEDWETVCAVNLNGAFLCAREAMKRMKGRGGRILNIGSVVSLKGYARQGAYTASKHGLLGLTKVIALEGRDDDIIAQAICPGGVDTDLVGDARPDLERESLMRPEEVAAAALFALGQQGNAVTDLIPLRRRDSAPFTV